MTTTMNPPNVEQRVVLCDVSWGLYQQLLAEHEDAPTPRFTYDRGALEITVPSFSHEQMNRVLADIFSTIADELGLDFINAGSTTFKRENLLQGVEPGTCFYVQHVGSVRGKRQLDLDTDPPPDLVIEIDVTHPSLNKFAIFANIGIPEVWRYNKGSLTFHRLVSGEYRPVEASETLPGVTHSEVERLLGASAEQSRAEWLRGVREYARQVRTP